MNVKAILILCCITLALFGRTLAQPAAKPFIKLTEPSKENNNVSAARQFIIGSVTKNSSLMINAQRVKVYSTGAFAWELNLSEGDTAFTIVAISPEGKSISKRIHYNLRFPKPAEPVKDFGIESIQTFPEGNLVLMPGDAIQFKVKAFPGANMSTLNGTVLYELPVTQTNGMTGIYQGTYMVQSSDSFFASRFQVTLKSADGQEISKATRDSFSVMSSLASDVAITKGRLAHLEYGLGDDRLGGAKIGYLDSLIPLKIIGKVGSHYKIRLAKSRTAYIPDEHVTLMAKGSFEPSSLTGKWNVYGDSVYDYVNVNLFSRLPYQSFQLNDPSRIVVDVFGATNNTNWITQMESVKEIERVWYEQVADDIFRINIQLKHRQHWGHQVSYRGNTLVIKIKQQPKNLSINKMVIALDAGHGGTNTGAGSPTGVLEKTLTLAVTLKLQKLLEAQGATVIMTRNKETFFDNKERILFYRDSLPDLLLSIHLNSSADPIRVGGTSTFYRYIGFRPLSHAIYKRMLELGLSEYGNNSSFNFMLNSPIEYPNALVEALFLSNPEEEEKILNETFQQQMAEKIAQGIKDFLEGCEEVQGNK
ncbi:MAG TPA: N-acetylmuramoyl-L-alanine amidase [Ferruginibacter sp.]|nr:N-acetylmuramoyl-L-alanine amidase [Ferruginibacter sp.]